MEEFDLKDQSLRITREAEERVSREIQEFFARNAAAMSDIAIKQFMRGVFRQDGFLLANGDLEFHMTPIRRDGEEEPITIKTTLLRFRDWDLLN